MRKRIGLIVGEQDSDYAKSLVESIFEEAKRDNVDVFVFANFGTYDHSLMLYSDGEMSIYKLPDLDSFDGFIIDETIYNIDGMAKAVYDYFTKNCNRPVVYLKGESERFYDLLVDDRAAIKEITKHFIEVHHFKDICHMTGRWELQDAKQRYCGYEEAMIEAGLEVKGNMVFYGDYWKNKASEAVDYFLEGRDKYPEAIVCANDYMAVAIMDVLQKRGIRVPEDIAVAGFDNTIEGEWHKPALTTVEPTIEKFGKEACRILKAAINGECPPKKQYITCTPIFRKSCGCESEDKSKNALEYRYKTLATHYYGIDMSVFMYSAYQIAMDEDDIYQTADRYYKYNGSYKSYICLCDGTMEDTRPVEAIDTYSDYIQLKRVYYEHEDKHYESPGTIFDRKLILPEEYTNTEEPGLYFVFPLHSANKVYGYMVSLYEDDKWPFRFTQCFTTGLADALDSVLLRRKYVGLDNIRKLYKEDELTGINNRRGYEQELAMLLDKAKRHNMYLSVGIIDMDNLKYINDTFGHSAGDACLKAIARAIKSSIGSGEVCARYGGDEFAIALCSDDKFRHLDFSDDFNKALAKEQETLGDRYVLHASIGICQLPENKYNHVSSSIRKADKLMYENKQRYKQTLLNAQNNK